MRIADKMQYDQVKNNISKNRTQMADLQNQAATQKRVTKPSDDPLAASRVLGNRIDLQSNQQFTKSLNYAKSFLEITDQSLGDLSEVLVRAKELALGQANDGSGNEESRRVVATEIQQLRNAMVSIGNRKLGDRFIFGGFSTQKAPFTPKGEFTGDQGEMNIHIDKETFLPMNVSGGRIFLGEGVDANGMAKQGPPQAKTLAEFEKQKLEAFNKARPNINQNSTPNSTPPNQAPGSPLNSPQGPAVGSLTEQGSVDHSREPASVQALLSEPEPKEEAAGTNLFSTLKDLEVSLRTNDKQGVQESLNVLDAALSQVVLSRSQVGSRSMTLDTWMQTLEKNKVDDQTQISSLEDADVFNTVSEINKTQATLQATLQTSGKLIQPSLMDFLR